jgi:hypothetical protein
MATSWKFAAARARFLPTRPDTRLQERVYRQVRTCSVRCLSGFFELLTTVNADNAARDSHILPGLLCNETSTTS